MFAAVRAGGEGAADKLIASLESNELITRLVALKLLAEVGTACTVGPLLEFLAKTTARNSPDLGWRERIAFTVSAWFRATRNEIADISRTLERRNVAFALCRLPPCIEARDALRELLVDPDEKTRAFAGQALQRLANRS